MLLTVLLLVVGIVAHPIGDALFLSLTSVNHFSEPGQVVGLGDYAAPLADRNIDLAACGPWCWW